jgi:hypothetical protein
MEISHILSEFKIGINPRENQKRMGCSYIDMTFMHRDGNIVSENKVDFNRELSNVSFTYMEKVNCVNVKTTCSLSYFSIRTVLTF